MKERPDNRSEELRDGREAFLPPKFSPAAYKVCCTTEEEVVEEKVGGKATGRDAYVYVLREILIILYIIFI